MRLTIRQRYAFGKDRELVGDRLVRPEAWDALRLGSDGPFAAPADRADLEARVDADAPLRHRAAGIDAALRGLGADSVASYGAGAGLVEAALARLRPERDLILSEYAPGTVERLSLLFPEARVERMELLRDAPLSAAAHLFHRIDTDLDDAQWRGVFGRFAGERVVLVAGDILDIHEAYVQLRRRLQRGTTDAGWLRTRSVFERLWEHSHQAAPQRFADHDGWVLEPLVEVDRGSSAIANQGERTGRE